MCHCNVRDGGRLSSSYFFRDVTSELPFCSEVIIEEDGPDMDELVDEELLETLGS